MILSIKNTWAYAKVVCTILVNDNILWQRTRNAIITVAETEDDIFYKEGVQDNLCYYYDGILNQHYTLIECKKAISGQFVQIQLNVTSGYIHIYEVEVHGF